MEVKEEDDDEKASSSGEESSKETSSKDSITERFEQFDYSNLTTVQLIALRRKLLKQYKERIGSDSQLLLADPQKHVCAYF